MSEQTQEAPSPGESDPASEETIPQEPRITIQEPIPEVDSADDDASRPQSADLAPEDHAALQGGDTDQQDDTATQGDDDVEPAVTASRPATSGRIPSQATAHAAFSRSSYVSHADFSSDDDDDDVSSGVLITEVKVTDDDTTRQRRRKSSKRSVLSAESTRFEVEEDDDGYWDTDLEMEDEKEEHDPSGRTQYTRACQRLGVVPVSYFARHITDNEIVMRYHGLGALGTKAIAKILRTNIIVERLNLTGNWLEGEGGMYMAKMLLENDYITELVLAENKLCAMGAHHLSKTLLVNTGLRHLDLSANDFTDDCAGCIAEALEQNKFLKELVLSRNHFEEEGGEILGPAIGANDVLDSLDLSWNLIRRQGAVAVARGLKENVRLKTINLSWNGFGAVGGAAVADAIAVNESLQEIDISGNRLEYDTAVLLAKALKRNEELKIIRLGHNPITTAGCIALAAALNESEVSALELLDLKDIPVEYEFLKLVAEIQKRRPEFRVTHGPVLRSGNTSSDIGKPGVDPNRARDPLMVLREHIVVNDMRIFDILKKYDETDTSSVPPDKFAIALEELGVPFSKQQLDEISQKLDKNEDGNIYYGDMLNQLEAAGGQAFKRPVSAARTRQAAAPDGGNNVAKLTLTKA